MNEKFKCDQCPAQYSSSSNLQRHKKAKHSDGEICKNRISTKSNKKFICELCGKVLASRYSWSCHKQRHTGKRPFQCQLCDARFFEGSNLRKHAKQKHNLDKIKISDSDKITDMQQTNMYQNDIFSNL